MIDVIEALKVKDNFNKYKAVRSILIKDTSLIESPFFCICIPTYNRADTLKETIESCLHQTGFDNYIIIVSDNNPERNDETEIYIQNLNCKNLKYYKHESNIGMFGNINRLFELSNAKYTICLHDDDLLFPHFLSIVYDTIDKYPYIDILYPNSVQWDSTKDARPIEKLEKFNYIYRNSIIDCAITCPHPPTGVVIKTESIIRIGGFDLESYPSNDYYFQVKVFPLLNVYTMHQPLYIYRWGVNATLRLETIMSFIKVDLPLKKFIINKCKVLYPFRKQIKIIYSNYKIKTLQRDYPDFDVNTLDMLFLNPSRFDLWMSNRFKFIFTKLLSLSHVFSVKIIVMDKWKS